MIYLIIFIAALIAAMTGIGGGVIVRPILSTTDLSIVLVSFYASVAIISSTIYSIGRAIVKKENINVKVITFLSIGSFIGGSIGNIIFRNVLTFFDDSVVVIIQSVLLIITLCFVLYASIKNLRINREFKSRTLMVLVGMTIGIISIFVGIGGGILNVVVLRLMFNTKDKDVVVNSLAMVFISQFASIMLHINNNVHQELDYKFLLLLISSSVFGGIVGKELTTKVDTSVTKKMFIIVITLVMLLNVYLIFDKII